MKLLTLNAHSLVEAHYAQKLADFAAAIAAEQPDILALQEVSQTACGAAVPRQNLGSYVPCRAHVTIREDNHVYHAVRLLADEGVRYHWTWLPIKLGYDKYDEGLALMSRSAVLETDVITVSEVDDYRNWKTRKLLGIRTEAVPEEWFYSVHFGWWDDPEAPFRKQWENTCAHLQDKEIVWLMGDFNNPAEVRGEGYDLMLASGWQDSYSLAKRKDTGCTVEKVIDGWRDKISESAGMRIDQIWCSKKADVRSAEVLFNGVRYPVVSDHYGVQIEYGRRGI